MVPGPNDLDWVDRWWMRPYFIFQSRFACHNHPYLLSFPIGVSGQLRAVHLFPWGILKDWLEKNGSERGRTAPSSAAPMEQQGPRVQYCGLTVASISATEKAIGTQNIAFLSAIEIRWKGGGADLPPRPLRHKESKLANFTPFPSPSED